MAVAVRLPGLFSLHWMPAERPSPLPFCPPYAHPLHLPGCLAACTLPPFTAPPRPPTAPLPSLLQGHEEIVWAVEVHGSRLFSASADKTIRVWDIASRRCEHVLEDHTRPVLSLAISGNRLYSGSYDFTIKVRSVGGWGGGALGCVGG